MTFADRLDAAIGATGNPCLLGIDPHLDLLPDEFAAARDPGATRADQARALRDFCLELLEVAAGRIPAVKPQSAFFELLGADGVRVWEEVVDTARAAGLIVIGDVKRGDIASTARAYARAHLHGADARDRAPHAGACDAITVNPFLGGDSIGPFLEVCGAEDAGLFVLVRTSNPGSADFQHHGEPDLSDRVAAAVRQWGEPLTGLCGWSSVGAVVGATHGAELARFRAAMPRTPLLLPGYGAQGATAADVVDAFDQAGRGALVASSRAVAFAGRAPENAGGHWKDAASAALDRMIAELTSALTARV